NVNGIVDQPLIQIVSDPDVREGSSLSVTVWLSQYTDHDVTATIAITTLEIDAVTALARWQQTQIPILIPAGEGSVDLSLDTVNDIILNGDSVYSLSLTNPVGADLGDDFSAPVNLLN